MHDRTALGPADVSDAELATMVARSFGVESVDLKSSSAAVHPYDLPAITTAGRFHVRGSAVVEGAVREFSVFVKHVHEWSRSPLFEGVPEEVREIARAGVPWLTEAEVYRSELHDVLPEGLAMPRTLGVREIDASSYALWLEEVRAEQVSWDVAQYASAAELLGRFAASTRVREVADRVSHPFTIDTYVEGRLRHQVVPMLRSDVWEHPLVAASFGSLRDRMLAAAGRVDDLAAELMALPHLAGHGDACPNNLLVRDGVEGFTMIDFGFFHRLPVGFDLGQLLVGDVQIGRRRAEDLRERDEACVLAYHRGLHVEGLEIPLEDIRRAHALHLLLFTGISSLPFELLGAAPTAEAHALAADRAALARHSLDLVDATA